MEDRSDVPDSGMPTIDDVFGPEGWLADHFKGYKVRPGQLELTRRILECLKTRTHFLAEAPTGTGKSLSYGLPAALMALFRRRRTVIATANITLQEQLVQKDLPLIQEVLARNLPHMPTVQYVLVKGMGNYVCHYKMEELSKNPPREEWWDELETWWKGTETGDKSELEKEYPGEIWSQVSTTSDDCLRGSCPQFEKCHIFKARQGDADIIVTNYHMLFADALVKSMGSPNGVLGAYSYLVMDEVHEAADIAQSFQGFEMRSSMLYKLARRMDNSKTPGAPTKAAQIRSCTSAFFKKVAGHKSDKIIQQPWATKEGQVLLDVLHVASETVARTADRSGGLEKAKLTSLARALGRKQGQLRGLILGDSEGKIPKGTVYYTEKRKGEPWLCCKVVEVQDFIRFNFLEAVPTIGVSATVTADTGHPGEEFDFIAHALGMDEVGYRSLTVDSPFDDRNFLLVLPDDIASPKEKEEHMDGVAMVVEDVVNGIGGRTMALFTSYKALTNATEWVRKRLSEDVLILVQGERPKMKIIEAFREADKALILATNSFWQGVDIQGEDLSCVIIDKLPFTPPTDPVLQYWDQEYKARRGSAFFKYSIPKAIIALKQGSGRLIRSETDYGAVVLCDNRVINARYGSQFYSAFPAKRYQSRSVDDAIHFINNRRK